MIKFIKDATDAVVTKNENEKKIKETNKELEIANTGLREIRKEIGDREKYLRKVNTIIQDREVSLHKIKKEERTKIDEKLNLEKQIQNLSKQQRDLKQKNIMLEKDIKNKDKIIDKMLQEIKYVKSLEDPILKKKKAVALLCSALKQTVVKKEHYCDDLPYYNKYYYPYEVNLDKLFPKEQIKEFKSDTTRRYLEPKLDNALVEVIERFNEKEDLMCLAYTNVMDELVNCIEKNNYTTRILYNDDIYFTKKITDAVWLYKNSISILFNLLTQKGYPIKGNEIFYLNLIKEKAIEKNYLDLEDIFFPLFNLIQDKSSISDVIHLYIQILDKKNIMKNRNLNFLYIFLVKNRFCETTFKLHNLENLLMNELENYEVVKLEKELYKSTDTKVIKKIILDDIELMTGVEFESYLVKLLQNLGFNANVTKGSGDQGVDIIARKQGKVYAIQAKRYTGSVGNKAVQEVVSGKEFYGADVSWVITNSHFTQAAFNLASKTNTMLWDGKKIKSMMELAYLS